MSGAFLGPEDYLEMLMFSFKKYNNNTDVILDLLILKCLLKLQSLEKGFLPIGCFFLSQ